MIRAPSRLQLLIQQLETGTEPTQDELRRIAALQALDIAKLGEDFVYDSIAANERETQVFGDA